VRWISYLLPLTYFTIISQGVMIRGAGLDTLLLPFGALTVMAVVVFSGAVLRFRRDLAPGHHARGATLPTHPEGGASTAAVGGARS
jgi:ABC-2 type transport system permease protein